METSKLNFKKRYRIELAKTLSVHWYSVWEQRKKKEKFLGHFPSSTTILLAYPQAEYLTAWIAREGYHESKQIRDEAGKKGTRIHQALELLLNGNTILEEAYTTEEWYKISTFVSWYKEYKPEIIATELPLFSRKHKFAGRVDCIAKVAGEIDVIDWKSSGSIYDHYPLQVASYAQAIEEMTDLKIANTAIFQMGAKNKDGYRFVLYPEWKEHFQVFRNVKKTWEYDSGKVALEPPILNLPNELKL